MKKPELMSPIRDWASLEACKDYADAVYFGVTELSMRAASGIKTTELESLKLCKEVPFIRHKSLSNGQYCGV